MGNVDRYLSITSHKLSLRVHRRVYGFAAVCSKRTNTFPRLNTRAFLIKLIASTLITRTSQRRLDIVDSIGDTIEDSIGDTIGRFLNERSNSLSKLARDEALINVSSSNNDPTLVRYLVDSKKGVKLCKCALTIDLRTSAYVDYMSHMVQCLQARIALRCLAIN